MFDIITDSACDLTPDTAKQLGVEVVPFYVSLDGEHYRKEGKEITVRDFYQFMVDNPAAYPKTSLASIEDFETAFRAHAAAGRDVLCLVFTGKMSGCVGSARNARELVLEDYPDARIEVMDSTAATVTEAVMVENAVAMRDAGCSLDETVTWLEAEKVTNQIFFTVGNLDYLIKGGRIGKVTGRAANMLGIKPMILFKDGEIFSGGVARGRQKSFEKALEQLMNYLAAHGGTPDDYRITVGYGYDADEGKRLWMQTRAALRAKYPGAQCEVGLLQIGCTIAVHTGPYALGMGVMRRWKKQGCQRPCRFRNPIRRRDTMQIFNTLTRQKEEFVPQVPGEYRIYVCGPTVYNYIHIGNARPLIVFDTLRRYLEYRGNKVIYVSNITDIDDKLIKKGQEEGTSMKEVAQRFEAEYLKDAEGLNCKKPTVQPRATEHIQQILDIVKDLIDSGHAYVAKNGDVYFRVKSDPSYGKLSHLKLDDLESGNRELRSQMDDDLKEDPADFAVWKAAKPGEPAWESPYGMGRPGWHIECSAMSRTHLGKTIDLHCGGQDLIFPHHENEIAQSECANGCTFARYWMHNGFINVDNQKMSKSLHNFFTVRDVANVYGYEPIRYFMLTAGYRMPLNYTVDLIESCKNSLERLYTCRENLDFTLSKGNFGTDESLKEKAAEAKQKFCTAMDDDLNTPDALAAVFDLVKDINTLSATSSKEALETAAAAFDEITGVLGLLYNRKKDEVPAEVTALVEKRAAAKKAKDWATADAIRAELTAMGWAVKDTAQGPQLSKL